MRGFCLEVWGDFACFTRPEMKVERLSYEIITPSAARAIFEAIFWKPAIVWNIKKIEVLNTIKWISVRRNEVSAVASDGKPCIYAEDNRQQRAALFLKDVRYRIHAEFDFIPPAKRLNSRNVLYGHTIDNIKKASIEDDEKEEKYAAMFERRAKKGQCFNQPYLGCREFSANFKLIANEELQNELKINPAINETRDLGIMLYDIDFADLKCPKPLWFRAKLENGVLNIPAWDDKEVLR
ncbi:MAG: type I-C CRISPR-associated protein Cas5c [Syntrophomonadaceae bacterium]|jgi:CRISPR-associated protein Cas5d|nr:type I-C CRISPR-associated protein Cas5c [Syntrophomonadaceae bacterium]